MAYVAKKMVMPTNYVDMTTKDLEYEGSFSWRNGALDRSCRLMLMVSINDLMRMRSGPGTSDSSTFKMSGDLSVVAGVVGLTGFSIEYKKEHPNM